PTRVLDITNVQAIRLHHTTGDEEGGYACLSHCWGTTRFLTTTTVNIESHQTTIPWDKLPPSFQDAITIAHKLSVPYLWIDSLCIIQDSQEDWQAESTQMASIYANGKITLAATMSDSGASETIHFRQTLTHGYGPDPGPSPLLTRGWVLQERLLSPRVVHFTRDELIWECMEKTTCECGSRASKAELTENWHQIVEQYSRLDLSFSRDRVPAISGAARRMSPYRNSRYFVGMWENSLIKDLMWARKGRLETTRRLGRVPTWSWVSIDSQVTY
ncbi:HET-domain-containing protein, partial [Thozetella sp. PMI_491]